MSAPFASIESFKFERKEELLDASEFQLSGNAMFVNFVKSFLDSQSELFEDEPEIQKRALTTLKLIACKFGFANETLPPILFKRIEELIFESASSEVIELSLQLVETLIERAPWTIDIFLDHKFPEIIYEIIVANVSIIPVETYSYVLTSLLCNSSKAYSILIKHKSESKEANKSPQDNINYLDYLIKKALDDIPKIDAVWVLMSLQSIISSSYFDETEYLNDIVNVALKYFEKNDSDIMCLVFMLFGRCLTSFQYLSDKEIKEITKKEIIERAYDLLVAKDMSGIGSLFIYIDNYIYISGENAMNFISLGFLQLFSEIFTLCNNEHQKKILGILKNAAVEPLEATLEVLKSPIVAEYLPDIIKTGRLSLKKNAIDLILTILVKVRLVYQPEIIEGLDEENDLNPYELILKLIQSFFNVVADLISSEDEEITKYCLYVLQFISTEIHLIDPTQAQKILDLFDEDLNEELYDILQCDNETLRGLSDNVIKSLKAFSEAEA